MVSGEFIRSESIAACVSKAVFDSGQKVKLIRAGMRRGIQGYSASCVEDRAVLISGGAEKQFWRR